MHACRRKPLPSLVARMDGKMNISSHQKGIQKGKLYRQVIQKLYQKRQQRIQRLITLLFIVFFFFLLQNMKVFLAIKMQIERKYFLNECY